MSNERGFTLVEVLVAFFLLAVGLAGTATMLDTANGTTAGTKARERAIGLQREVVEAARSIPYDELTPASVVPATQAKPGLGSQSAGTSWKIRRGGVTYTLTLGACSVDDPSDGLGTHDPASFCGSGSTATTPARCRQLLGLVASGQTPTVEADAAADVGSCGIDLDANGTVDNLVEASVGLCLLCAPTSPPDSTPDDYKRIVTSVTWDRGTGGRYALQATTVPNPGSAAGPATTALTRTAPSGTGPVTDPTTTSVSFSATTSRPAATVAWSVNGATRAPGTGSQTTWSWDWPLGNVDASDAVLDGPYLIAAKAFDANGVSGATRSMTVVVNRRQPYAPPNFVAGRNGDGVEFEWTTNRERDIEGYKVYQETLTGRTLACTLTRATSCRQSPAPTDPVLTYHVVAVDKDAAGVLREGDRSPSREVTVLTTPPTPPSDLTAVPDDGAVTLSWTPSPSADVEFYRIYRDGQSYDDRYDRVAANQSSFTDTRTDGASHTYWITAVNGQLAESTVVGPVTP